MVKKTKLTTDNFEFDPSMDFADFGMDEIDEGINPELKKKKSRSPVMDVFKGTIKGAGETLKDPNFVKSVVKRSMPDSYGTIFEAAGQATETGAALYDEAVKELKPQISKIAKKVDRLIPDESKGLKKISSKISSMFGDEASIPGSSKESMQDQSIANSLGQIFQVEQQQALEGEARENAESRVRDHIEGKRFTSNFGVLSSINENIQRVSNYTEKVTQAYQKKSLELQFRSLFVQTELLSVSNKYFEVFKNQNEAVAKNTSLPEFVKINNSERFKDIARTKFFDNIQTSLFGADSKFGKMLKRMKVDASNYIKGAKQGLESGMMGLDGLEQMQEMNATMREMGLEGTSSSEMAGMMMGNSISGYAGDKFSKFVKPHLLKNKKVTDFGFKTAGSILNPGGAIDSFRKSEAMVNARESEGAKGIFANMLDKILDYGMDQRPDMKLDNTGGIKQNMLGSVFDGRTQKSIVDVIPGYLSRILREVSIIRTGDDKIEAIVFDQTKGAFVSKKEMGATIKSNLSKRIKSGMMNYNLEKSVENTFENVPEKKKATVKKFMANISRIPNMEYTPENIMNTEVFKNLDKGTKKIIKDTFDSKITNNEEDGVENQFNLTSSITSVRNSTADIRGEIELFVKGGYGELLEEQGILKRTENNDWEIDQDAYYKLLDSEGIVTSDKNAKRDIKTANVEEILGEPKETTSKLVPKRKAKPPVSKAKTKPTKAKTKAKFKSNIVKSDITTKEDISPFSPNRALEAIKSTKIFKWFYKEGEGDQIEHTGPMAQDVNKTMGNEAAPGGVQLDLTTMNGNNMAAIQALSDKQDKMMKGETSGSILKQIRKDTSAIVELLKNGKGGDSNSVGNVQSGNASYTNLAGSMFGQVGTLAGKLTGDAVDLGKQAFDTTVKVADKGVKGLKAVTPGIIKTAKGTAKGILTTIEGMTNGLKGREQDKHFAKKKVEYLTADDLLKIRAIQETSKLNTIMGKLAKKVFERYAHLETLDTSDEAVEKARNNPNAGNTAEEGSYEERSMIQQIGNISSNISTGIGRGLTDVFTNKIPKAAGFLRDFAKTAKIAAITLFGKAHDVYIKGQNSPVIKAYLLKAGYYRDQATGEIVRTMGDLKKLKGNLVDKAGNVVLTIEDAAKGLVDSKGAAIKTGLERLSKMLMTKGLKGIARGNKFLKGALKVGAGVIDKGAEMLGKMKFPGFLGFGSGKIYDVLVEIRDIIKGKSSTGVSETPTEPKPADDFVGPVMPATVAAKRAVKKLAENTKAKLLAKAKEIKDEIEAKINPEKKDLLEEIKAKVNNKKIAKRSRVAGKQLVKKTKKAKASIQDLAAKTLNKPSVTEVDNVSNDVEQTVEPLSFKDKVKERIKTGVNTLKNKIPKANLDPQYRSSKNVIDTMMDKGKGLLDRFSKDGEDTEVSDSKPSLKERFNTVKDKVKEKIPKTSKLKQGLGKVKGSFGKGKLGLIGLAGQGISKGLSMFKSKEEPTTVEEVNDHNPASNAKAQESEGKQTPKRKREGTEKKRVGLIQERHGLEPMRGKKAFNDKDGDGKREGNADDEIERKKKAHEDSKNKITKANLDPQYRSKENIIDTMMNKASSIFDMASKGLGGIFGGAGDMMSTAGDMLGLGGKGGILGKLGSLGKGALNFVKSPIKGLGMASKGLGGLVRGGVGIAARALPFAGMIGNAAAAVGTTIATGATAAIGAVGTGLAAIGSFLASPVVLGALAVAAVGYGAYKAYKYFTRDKVDDFEQIRMYQYGLTKGTSKSNHLMLSLEEYLLDGRIGYDGGKAYILDKKVDPKELINIFNIDENDEEKCIKFHAWFTKRFKPFFLTHLTALYSVNKTATLNKVSKLTEEEQIKYLPLITFESGPYNESTSPVDDPETLDDGDNKKAVKDLVDEMVSKLKKEGKKLGVFGTIKAALGFGTSLAVAGPLGLIGAGFKAITSSKVGTAVGKAVYSVKDFISKKFDAMLPGLSAIGDAVKNTGPLGAMAVAAISRIFKYFSKGNKGKYEQIRALQYGLTEDDGYYLERVIALEEYLLDGKIGYDNGKAYVLDKKTDNSEMLSLMSIDPSDVELCTKFSTWFSKRFKPFFLTHVTSLFAINKKLKLNDVYKLTDEEQLKLLTLVGFENGPYDETTSPFKDIENLNIGSNKDLVKKAIDNISGELAKKVKKKTFLKDLFDKPAEAKDSKSKAADSKPANVKPVVSAPIVPQPLAALPKTNDAPTGNKDVSTELGGEGDGKSPDTAKAPINPSSTGMMDKMKIADGPLKDGSGADQFLKVQPGVKFDTTNPSVLKNFRAMVQEFGETTGKAVQVNSGSRTTAEQAALYQRDPKTAAKPGKSLHEFGLALDVNSKDANEMEEAGLMRKYGFTRPVGGEPWHVEPAGIQTNISLAKKDADFATQAVDASLFKGGGGAGTVSGIPKGKRDAGLAMQLLDQDAQVVKATDKDKVVELALKPKNVKLSEEVKTASYSKSTNSGSVITAANDKSYTDNTSSAPKAASVSKPVPNSSIAQSEKYSKVDGLPDIEKDPKTSSIVNSGKIINAANKQQVTDAVEDISKKQGTEPKMMAAFAAVESGLNPNAKASGSSATGLFQFTKGTWDEQVSKNARKHNLDPNVSPTDINASTLMATEYVKSNTRALKSVKSDINLTDVYLAHFLGASGAKKFLKADPNAIAAEVMPDAANTKGNKNIFYDNGKPLTVSEVYGKLDNKLINTAKDYGISLPAAKGLSSPSKQAESSLPPVNPTIAGTSQAIKVKPEVKPPVTTEVKKTEATSVSPITGQTNVTAKAPDSGTVSTQTYNNMPKKGSLLNNPANVISSSDSANRDNRMQTNNDTMTTVSDTLLKQLVVQQDMRDAILSLSKTLSPEALNDFVKKLTSKTPEVETPKGRQMPAQGKSTVNSAIDLTRKIA